LSDPALRRILVLYLPIALGLIVSNMQVAIDQRLASSTGESSVAWMDRATTLIQLPHGLVAVAISLAVLPTLSRQSAADDQDGFRRTLGLGLRLVLVLIIPATLGLLVMAEPITSLIFEHGRFTANDTYWTAWALRCYLAGLVFAAIDWPLNYAFYARQNTLTPALVGILSVGVYLVLALVLIKPLGMLGLVLADSAKHFSHAITMLILTWRRIGNLSDQRLG
ncbi:MAG: oligosaccharide flippase family protein, partial [Anaerolineae bacterium]|nr:oligosaccharide flippase family protein [Anaerolineae bacterium]